MISKSDVSFGREKSELRSFNHHTYIDLYVRIRYYLGDRNFTATYISYLPQRQRRRKQERNMEPRK